MIFAAAGIVERDVLINASLPAEAAFRIGTGSQLLGKAVQLAAFVGLLTSWNACLFATARVFTILNQLGVVGDGIGKPTENRPVTIWAVVIPSVLGLAGAFGGREVFSAVLNACALSIGMLYFVTCLSLVVLRPSISENNRVGRGVVSALFPYGATIITAIVTAYIVYEPLTWTDQGLPIEWAMFLGAITVVTLYWLAKRHRWAERASEGFKGIP